MTHARPMNALMLPLLALASVAAMVPTSRPSVYVQPGDVDWQSIVGDPPAADAQEHKDEQAELHFLQNRRTATQVARCRADAELTPGVFADVVGAPLTLRAAPDTVLLLQQVRVDTAHVNAAAKEHYHRARPYGQDPTIEPCVTKEIGYSYPSGNAAVARAWARVLAELYPQNRDALLARADQIASDRVTAGAHFRSDVVAGEKLGDAVADKLLDRDDFKVMLSAARTSLPPR